MANTPEGKVKDQIKKDAIEMAMLTMMPQGGTIGRNSESDFVFCHQGLFIAIEVKAGPPIPTLAQQKWLIEAYRAGALVGCIGGVAGPITARVANAHTVNNVASGWVTSRHVLYSAPNDELTFGSALTIDKTDGKNALRELVDIYTLYRGAMR